jgi:hypothetical protein
MTMKNYSEDEEWVICRNAVSENYKIIRSIFGKDMDSKPSEFSKRSKRDYLAETQTAIAKRFFIYDDDASEFCKKLIQNKKNWQDKLSKENLVSLFLLQNKAISIALKNYKLPQVIEDKVDKLADREYLATPIEIQRSVKGAAGLKKKLKNDLTRVETYRQVMNPIVEKLAKLYHLEITNDPFVYLENRFGKMTMEDYYKMVKLTELGVDLNGNLISRNESGALFVNNEPIPDDYVIDFGMEVKTPYEDDEADATDYSEKIITSERHKKRKLSTSKSKIVENFMNKKENKGEETIPTGNSESDSADIQGEFDFEF